MRMRLMPFTITVASLFLVLKIIDVIHGGEELSQAILVSEVQANQPSRREGGVIEEADKEGVTENIQQNVGDITERRFTSVELELLQKLSQRREELDSWQENLEIKEATMEATENRIDEKIAHIETMKKEVGALLAEYNKIEDAKIGSLVKIYENMRPNDAARIFDEVEMPILLLVIDRMKEKKAAPILAAMDARKAKHLTVELAERRRLESNRIKDASAPGVAPPATN